MRLRAYTAILAALMAKACVALFPSVVFAESRAELESELREIEREVAGLEQNFLRGAILESDNRFAARMNDGQFFFYSKQYDRASMVLLDLVEDPANRNVAGFRDAVYFLAESLFRIRNHNAAARYLALLHVVGSPDQKQHALARLLDLAMRSGDRALGEKFARIADRQVTTGRQPQLLYSLGKYHYRQGRLSTALRKFRKVGQDAEEYLRARYFVGVIELRLGQIKQARATFELVAVAQSAAADGDPADTHVRNQAQLALARIAYETGEFDQAVALYNQVPRASAEFDRAMYESVWISIKRKEYKNALRKLDLLLISQPNVLDGPDAKLLEGKLQLMMGRYDEAEAAFDTVSESFGAVHKQMQQVLRANPDLEGHFGKVIGDRIAEFDLSSLLPPEAARIAGDDVRSGRAMDLVSDVAAQRRDVRDASRAIERLQTALSAENRLEMFPKIHTGVLRGIELKARLLMLRGRMNAVAGTQVRTRTPQYRVVKKDRETWQQRFATIPRTVIQMKERDAKVDQRMLDLEQAAHRLRVDLRAVEAQLVAVSKYLKDTASDAKASSARSQVKREMEEAKALKSEIEALAWKIEDERMRVGVNDYAARSDERVEREFRRSIGDELGWLSGNGVRFGDDLRARCAVSERQIDSFVKKAESFAQARIREFLATVKHEKSNVGGYSTRLGGYETRTKALGGTIAARSFRRVLDRIADVVLVADVGLIDVAWKQKDDKSQDIDHVIDKQRVEYNGIEAIFGEVTGD